MEEVRGAEVADNKGDKEEDGVEGMNEEEEVAGMDRNGETKEPRAMEKGGEMVRKDEKDEQRDSMEGKGGADTPLYSQTQSQLRGYSFDWLCSQLRSYLCTQPCDQLRGHLVQLLRSQLCVQLCNRQQSHPSSHLSKQLCKGRAGESGLISNFQYVL